MGERGPVPKRADQRRRRNGDDPITRVAAGTPVVAPLLAFPAHPIAQDWYDSLARSGQARFFEPSDWQAARLVAYDLTRHLHAGRVSAQMLAAIWSAMGDLLTTEASRRRVRMEIDRTTTAEVDAAQAAKVAVMDEYRRGVGAS
ncbi:MAG TPA: hypothetical protein VF755_00955 [Catenuloplanes sp.]|jgi:hypothetical protein